MEWINTKERLPEEGKIVLTYHNEGGCDWWNVGAYDGRHWVEAITENQLLIRADYWAEIEPPISE